MHYKQVTSTNDKRLFTLHTDRTLRLTDGQSHHSLCQWNCPCLSLLVCTFYMDFRYYVNMSNQLCHSSL